MLKNTQISWNITPCRLLNSYPRFNCTCCLYLQDTSSPNVESIWILFHVPPYRKRPASPLWRTVGYLCSGKMPSRSLFCGTYEGTVWAECTLSDYEGSTLFKTENMATKDDINIQILSYEHLLQCQFKKFDCILQWCAWKVLKCGAGERRRRSVGPTEWEMKKCYIESRRGNWIGHILLSNCLLKHVIEGKTLGG